MELAHDIDLSIALSRVSSTSNKYELAALLDEIANIPKPADTDLSPLFQLLADARWLVRHSAIQALKNTNSTEVENKLLLFLQNTSDPFDLIYCHSVLNHIGTRKSFPALQNSLKSKKRDVKLSAQAAITAIEQRAKSLSQKK